MRGKQRSWKWFIATGLGVTAFLALTALAFGALSERSKSVKIAAADDGTAKASCPSGTEAVSGGFAAPGFDPQFDEASIIPFGSSRTGRGAWTVDARNFGMTPGKMTAYVYCDQHKPGLDVVTKTVSIDARQSGSATAQCPGGSEVFSGGWRSPNDVTGDHAFFAFTSMRASDRKWKVTAFNDDNDNAHDLTVFAYCDSRKPGLVQRSKDTKVASGKAKALAPQCPNGRQAVSGGFQSSETVANTADAAFTVASRRTATSTWRTVAYGNGPAGTKSPITAFAYCKK